MRILQVSGGDSIGGADKVAYDLYTGYRARGHESRLAVESKKRSEPDIVYVHTPDPWARFWQSRSHVLDRFHLRLVNRPFVERGLERRITFSSRKIPQLLPKTPDILHMHNLHGWYFDLEALPFLSAQLPTVLTLHDAWLLSGHCAHSFDCNRWEYGCGLCPDLSIYPAIKRDATAENWLNKQDIYQRSRLSIVTPSQWLMNKVARSMLASAAVDTIVIPNGIDLSIFHSSDKINARKALHLPLDVPIIMFAANGIRQNVFKDYKTLRKALEYLGEQRALLCLALGEDAPSEYLGQAEIRFIPQVTDPHIVAQYYQAADLYVHATRADTFPNTILEALACSVPVIGTRVGGIPEQIDDGITGMLVSLGDARELATRIEQLLDNSALRYRMGIAAAEQAQSRFSLSRAIDHYLAWYETILERRARQLS